MHLLSRLSRIIGLLSLRKQRQSSAYDEQSGIESQTLGPGACSVAVNWDFACIGNL